MLHPSTTRRVPAPLTTALLTLLLTTAATAQQEWWVDATNGFDGNPGTYTQPLQSLTQAVSNAGDNDRIFLLSGTYGAATNEALPIALGITSQLNLEIRGVGNAVLDLGSSTTPAFRLVNGANGARITNLTITNSDRLNWWTRVINSGSGVDAGDAASNVEIDRCRFTNINRGFVLWTQDNVQGWKVHDNLFWDCTNDAILEYSGDNDFYNNTFVTGTWKAYISDSATSRFQNNVIVGCAIAFENNNAANNLARYENNWIYQCPTVAQGVGMAGGLPASNTVGVDPLFVNQGAGDFHLQPTSPLIDGGTAAITMGADLDDISRNVDSDQDGSLLPDIGCYETTPASLSVTYDPVTGLYLATADCTLPNSFVFLLFCFDDGVVNVPGQPVVLIDQASFVPATLTGTAPLTTGFSVAGVPIIPGQRLVVQGLVAALGAPSFQPTNRVWTQL